MKTIVIGVLNRLREPSTMSALAAGLALFGVNVAPEAYDGAMQVIGGIAVLLGVFLPERPTGA